MRQRADKIRPPRRKGRARPRCAVGVSVLALGALVSAGCAAIYNFRTEEVVLDPERVAQAGSYAFAADFDDPVAGPSAADLVDHDIRAALEHELTARGWTTESREAADVMVSYSIGGTEGASLISDVFPGAYSTVSAAHARELAYVDQALVVDLYTAPSGESIWRGQAVARLYGPMGQARTEMINQAVARIIAQLDDDL